MLCAHTCAHTFVCTQVRASLKCCGLTLMLILDCLCRVSEITVISWLSISHPLSLTVGLALSHAVYKCVCVCVCWTVGTGYNCIALPSHSVSTPICLLNIQLSTLDLEASMTAQSHIHNNTSMADFFQRPQKWQRGEMIERQGKEMRNRKTRCKMLSLRQRWTREHDG